MSGEDTKGGKGGSATSLHEVARLGNLKLAEWLLERGAEVNARGPRGWTALHWAASNGHAEVVRLLLEFGADQQLQSEQGVTAARLAEARGHLETARLLAGETPLAGTGLRQPGRPESSDVTEAAGAVFHRGRPASGRDSTAGVAGDAVIDLSGYEVVEASAGALADGLAGAHGDAHGDVGGDVSGEPGDEGPTIIRPPEPRSPGAPGTREARPTGPLPGSAAPTVSVSVVSPPRSLRLAVALVVAGAALVSLGLLAGVGWLRLRPRGGPLHSQPLAAADAGRLGLASDRGMPAVEPQSTPVVAIGMAAARDGAPPEQPVRQAADARDGEPVHPAERPPPAERGRPACARQWWVLDPKPGERGANLHRTPSMGNNIVAEVRNCTRVCQRDVAGNWVRVELPNRRVGFIHRSRLAAATPRACR